MSTRTWIIFIVITVGILGTLFYVSNRNSLDVSDVSDATVVGALESNGEIADHRYGNPDNRVVLIEYGDFQCPGCGSAWPRVNALKERYSDQLTFVYRNLPLTSIHPHARAAASSAEAAGLQGKYWEMHDLLFERQSTWTSFSAAERTDAFRDYAAELGLDLDQYNTDITSSRVSSKVNFDIALAKKHNVHQSTPVFMLDDEVIPQDIWGSDEALDAFIREKLTEAGFALPPAASAILPEGSDE